MLASPNRLMSKAPVDDVRFTTENQTGPLMDLLAAWPMARIWREPVAAAAESEAILELTERANADRAAAWALLVHGSALAVQGMHTSADRCFRRADALFRGLDDDLGLAHLTLRQDLIWLDREDYDRAIPALNHALQIARAHLDRSLESSVLNDLGLQFDLAGRPEEAATHLFQALEIADDDDLAWQATVRYNIGYVLSNQPDHAAAITWIEEALELADRIGDASTAVYAHESIASSLEALGFPEFALIHLHEGLLKASAHGYQRSFAWLSLEAGRLLADADPVAALEHCVQSAAAFRQLGDDFLVTRAWLADWRAATITGAYTDDLLGGLTAALRLVSETQISELTMFAFYDALVDTCRALGRKSEALEFAITGSDRKIRYWKRLAESRGIESARRHQLDHAQAVAKRERDQRILLTKALHDLDALNRLNEDLVRQLQEQAILLERQATEDALTGIGNRRYFDSHLEREAVRATTFSRPIAVALADVDLFKRVNDRFTHQVGDCVLQLVAGLMQSECRGTDIVARHGGEEFAFLFPETTLAESGEQAERIRKAVESYDWGRVAPGLRVTISIGVVGSKAGADPSRLMAGADAMLYLAKHRGRNQVRIRSLADLDREWPLAWTIPPAALGESIRRSVMGTDALRRPVT